MISMWAQPEHICINMGKLRTLMGYTPGVERRYYDPYKQSKPAAVRPYKYTLINVHTGEEKYFYTQQEIQEFLNYSDSSGVSKSLVNGSLMRRKYRLEKHEETE